MATTVDTLLVRIEADLAGLRRDLKRVEQTTQQSSQKIGRSLNNIDSGFSKIGRTAKALAPLLAGALGVGAVRSFVRVGSEVENLRIRLKFLFGDVEEGAKAFEVMAQFASRVPFSLQEIQNASGSLASVAKNANQLNELLVITGNIAAAFPISFSEAAANLQRAFSAGANSADLFREKGVLAMAGFQAGATVSIDETIQKFSEAFGTGGRIDGATEELATTFTGVMSMLGDAVFNFQRQVVDAGLLDAFKELAEFLRENVAETDRLARVIGGALASAVRGITTALKFVLENLTSIIIALGVFASIKTVAAITGVGLAFVSLATNVAKAGGALKALRMILLASPLTAIAVAAAVAAEKMGLLDPVLEKIKSKFNELYPPIEEAKVETESLTSEIKDLAKELTAGNANKATDEFTKKTKSLADQLAITRLEARGFNADFARVMQDAGFDPEKMKIRGDVEGVTPAVFRTGTGATDDDRMKQLRNQFENLRIEQKKIEQIDLAETFLEQRDSAGQLQEQMDALNAALLVMPERKDEINAALGELGLEMKRLDPMFKATEDAARQAGDAVADVLADAVMQGKLDANALKAIFADLVKTLIAEAIKTFIIRKIMAAVFGGFGGGGSVGPSSGSFGDAFMAFAGGGRIPARATGGPVLVGERGPELFIPHSAGSIKNKQDTKNMLQGGGAPVNVYQTIQVDTGVSQTVKTEMMNMLPRFKAETMQAVIDGKRRGKAISKVFA